MKWTYEEFYILTDCREKKISFSEIQKNFFPYRTEKSITEKALREGLTNGYTIFSPSENQKFFQLLKERKSFREIKKSFSDVSIVALRIKAMRLKQQQQNKES
jgi:hypothetical protein